MAAASFRSSVRGDLDVERRALDDRAALAERLDKLAVVGDCSGDPRALGVRPASSSRRKTCGVWAR